MRARMEASTQGKGAKSDIFNRGGTWEELKATALEETGLPPPKAPWEVPLRGPMIQLPHLKNWKDQNELSSKSTGS